MDIAQFIDHTALKPDVTVKQIEQLVNEAKTYQFKSICINPGWVSKASELLADTNIDICTVIGFPIGATTTEVKAFETKEAIKNGATEVDMVINIGELKNNNEAFVKEDIKAVVDAAGSDTLVKVIIETCLLSDDEKVTACQLAVSAGADFVKTSTGFAKSGATTKDIELMRDTVGADIGVKASGGVRTLADVQAMIKAGASRIGASAGVSIIKEASN